MPGLYLLGGSSARESIVSGEALAAEIREAGGPEVAAYDLGSINQNFAESLAVVQSAPDTPAWLLVGINLGRFTATKDVNAQQAEGREFLLESEAVHETSSRRSGTSRSTRTPSSRASGRTSPTGRASTAPTCWRATRRAPSTGCTGTRRRRGARTATRSGS